MHSTSKKIQSLPGTRYSRLHAEPDSQKGSALIAVLLVSIIVGLMSISMFDMSDQAQVASSSTIQRNRAFQSIDAALFIAESDLADSNSAGRLFSDATASEGIFRQETREDQWWNDPAYAGQTTVAADTVTGVVEQPRYVYEEVGDYVYDGGTGVVNLDIGAGAYGRKTSGGREVVLYSIEAYGNGSFDSVKAAAESMVVFSR